MTTAEKIELALIPLLGICSWLIASELPNQMDIGQLLLAMSAFLLLQSLIRDLWLLANQRGTQPELQRKIRCMCAESTVGMTGIIVGIVLLGVGIDASLPMSNLSWSILVMAIMSLGFIMKDYVIEWNPFRLHKDLDHINIIFTWNKGDQNKKL